MCLGACLGACLGVCNRVQSGAYLGAYSQAGGECAIEYNWERTCERLESVLRASGERLESVLVLVHVSVLGSVQWSAFGSMESSVLYAASCIVSSADICLCHSNLVNAQVHRTLLCHASNILWNTVRKTASLWAARCAWSFFPVWPVDLVQEISRWEALTLPLCSSSPITLTSKSRSSIWAGLRTARGLFGASVFFIFLGLLQSTVERSTSDKSQMADYYRTFLSQVISITNTRIV